MRKSTRSVYRTRLWSLDHGQEPKPPYLGRGWHVELWRDRFRGKSPRRWEEKLMKHYGWKPSLEHCKILESGEVEQVTAPEIRIHAINKEIAQEAFYLIAAAIALEDFTLLDDGMLIVTPVGQYFRDAPALQQQSLGMGTSGLAECARIAAKISQRRNLQYALWKFYLAFKTCPIHWMDTHPKYGNWHGVEAATRLHSIFATSITLAYGVIEELGLEVRGSKENPTRMHDGRWNPKVRRDLEKRLIDAGVDLSQEVTWAVRNPPTRVEKKSPHPTGKATDWTKGPIRDRKSDLFG